MRRIVMFNRVTADGYFSSADGKLDWVVPDPEVDSHGASGTAQTDTVLFGRRTYEMMAAFWPHVTDSDPHDAGRSAPAIRAMGKFLNDATKLVFSRTLKDVTWRNSRLVRELDPKEIAAMKKQPGKDMIVLGSGSVVSELTAHGLIDEYDFVVAPVLLGSGRSLINGLPKTTSLELLDTKKYSSGNVMLRYGRKG
jgi:dihydrofolate reductase